MSLAAHGSDDSAISALRRKRRSAILRRRVAEGQQEIGARVAGLAGASEVLVSSTVKVRSASFASFQTCGVEFRFTPNTGHGRCVAANAHPNLAQLRA